MPHSSRVVLGTDHRSALGEVDSLLSGHNCTHVYLDVGTNIGVQIRKLYQPHLYPGAKVLPDFELEFGPSPRCPSVCAIGFEPNPRHWDRLDRLQESLRAAGAGETVSEAGGAFDSVLVNAVDLNKIVHHVNHHLARGKGEVGRGQTPRIMMKLDIEGAEQHVLPHMLAGFSLCLVDRLIMEFHARQYDAASIQTATAALGLELGGFDSRDRVMRVMDAVRMAFEGALNAPGNDCRVTLANTDDETYLHDGNALGDELGHEMCGAQVPVPAGHVGGAGGDNPPDSRAVLAVGAAADDASFTCPAHSRLATTGANRHCICDPGYVCSGRTRHCSTGHSVAGNVAGERLHGLSGFRWRKCPDCRCTVPPGEST